MPSSKDRKRLEVPTYLYSPIKVIATAEDRTVASVLSELLISALQSYRPAWLPKEHLRKLTVRARRVLDLTQQAAPAQFNHNYVGTEHLLLALAEDGDSLAGRMLARYGVTPIVVRKRIETIIGRGAAAVTEPIELTPRARKVLGFAVEEANRLDHPFVGTGHLLLGLLREGGGIAVAILEARQMTTEDLRTGRLITDFESQMGGVDLEDLRNATLRALAQGDMPLSET
ncbi:MAG TPA: Clp protease N-terminal domain-containing protein [Chloroflexota bacterium]|nr:Clp protease N-terminal domain-containing protein [Chloroflexota bacterium]